MANVTVSDYQVLRDSPFVLNTLDHTMGFHFTLPSSFVFGTRLAKPVLGFIVRPQSESVRFSISGNSGPPTGTEGFPANTFDISRNIAFQGAPKMDMALWEAFSGADLTSGSHNSVKFVCYEGELRIRDVILWYQREVQGISFDPSSGPGQIAQPS